MFIHALALQMQQVAEQSEAEETPYDASKMFYLFLFYSSSS